MIENTMEDEQAKFEDAIAQVEVADTLVNNIRNPAIRSMINALKAVMRVPFIGDLIDSSISTTFEDNQKKKRDQLINIILSDKQRITKDMVNNVEFIVNFARVMDAVNRLAKNEKVEYFANLIKHGYLSNSESTISNDEFEEFFYEISMLSFRELEYLAFFWKYAERYGGEVSAHQWGDFSKEFSEKYGDQEPKFVYRRLIKTGLIYEIRRKSFLSEAAAKLDLGNEGYRIDEEFKRFYDIVLNSHNEEGGINT